MDIYVGFNVLTVVLGPFLFIAEHDLRQWENTLHVLRFHSLAETLHIDIYTLRFLT